MKLKEHITLAINASFSNLKVIWNIGKADKMNKSMENLVQMKLHLNLKRLYKKLRLLKFRRSSLRNKTKIHESSSFNMFISEIRGGEVKKEVPKPEKKDIMIPHASLFDDSKTKASTFAFSSTIKYPHNQAGEQQ
jgi:hypothetical protein